MDIPSAAFISAPSGRHGRTLDVRCLVTHLQRRIYAMRCCAYAVGALSCCPELEWLPFALHDLWKLGSGEFSDVKDNACRA
jgi:hypothetical protein